MEVQEEAVQLGLAHLSSNTPKQILWLNSSYSTIYTWQLLPAPLQISSCTPHFLKRLFCPLYKITSKLFFPKYFKNVFSETCFMNSGFINLEIKIMYSKKNVLEWFLPSRFCILEISFPYGTTISKIPKTIKDNFCIFEECRHAERKV